MKSSLRPLLGLLCWLTAAGSAQAQDAELQPAAAPFLPRWEVSVAAQLGFSIEGDRCLWNGSDVFACSRVGFIAFEFAPRYRFRHLSVGAVAQLGKGDELSLLHFGAEARFLPLDTVDVEPWIGVDAGAALLIDALPMDEFRASESFVTVAPAFGASAGLEFAVGETVSFGVIARLLWLALGTQAEVFQKKPGYNSQLALNGGIVGTYRFGR